MASTLKCTREALFSTNHSTAAVVAAAGDNIDDLEVFVDFFNRIRKFGALFSTNHSTAAVVAAAGDNIDDLEVFVDFFNRIRKFGGQILYRRVLDLLLYCKQGEIAGSDIYDEIVELFGNRGDLVSLFESIVPEPYISHKKRKIEDGEIEYDWWNPPNRISPERAGGKVRIMSKHEKKDFEMEDLLCKVDVDISNLESTHEKAENLLKRRRDLSEVRLEEQFTPLNLGFIRELFEKRSLVFGDNGNPVGAIWEVIDLLGEEKVALEKYRKNIIKRWNMSRRYRVSH